VNSASGGHAIQAITPGGANSIGNPVDYAMTGLGWSGAQSTKPDGANAPTAVYGLWNYYMRGSVIGGVPLSDGSRLYRQGSAYDPARGRAAVVQIVLPWDSGDFPDISRYPVSTFGTDPNPYILSASFPLRAGAGPAEYPAVARYEAMSFGAPGRWPPLGCVAASAGPAGFTSVDGTTDVNYWLDLVTDPELFKQHRWHSAQFRMNIAKQSSYWKSIYASVK